MKITILSISLLLSLLLNLELWQRARNYRKLLESYLAGEKAKLIGSAIGAIASTILLIVYARRIRTK